MCVGRVVEQQRQVQLTLQSSVAKKNLEDYLLFFHDTILGISKSNRVSLKHPNCIGNVVRTAPVT